MTHHDIRKRFIDYFVAAKHREVAAASLIPDNDPSVLFTVAGMQQFKDFYAHPEAAPSARLVTIQPCIRTIDIDEVGDDTHNTVFEMLGNFSFGYTGQAATSEGPYFKQEALSLAWDFLTKELGIAKERIRATYFGGDAQRPADTDSQALLGALEGLTRVEAYGDDNFWGPVGDEGPCGPTVEFYVDDVEVWNNVFNEYYRDREGSYTRLAYQGVDTGMGLERLALMLQEKQSVYETDLLAPLVAHVSHELYSYDERHVRIIVDHTKAALFLLCDGVRPGSKTREYVVRRLIRRAVRSAQLVHFHDFAGLLKGFIKEYGPYYERIAKQGEEAIELFLAEREKFVKTLEAGTSQLRKLMHGERDGELSGEEVFRLFDTYGFPLELTQEIAHESGWTIDLTGFEEAFRQHREKSRSGSEKVFKGGLADSDPKTVAHHTAHHLLLAALRSILGDHVVQRGSNITAERLRIDVSHPERMSEEQLRMAESLVNQVIAEDLPMVSEVMDRDEAFKSGALAEFGIKYPKEVTVYTVIDQNGEPFSRELCGGPHAHSTGELGRFEILKEEASGSGIRRIRARLV